MAEGETFEFVLTPEEAYGERTEKHIVNVARETFCQNGHFDHDNVFVGAEIPLQNEDGNRFTGKVMEIADDNVKIDLNHPLAGLTLRFTGEIRGNDPPGETHQRRMRLWLRAWRRGMLLRTPSRARRGRVLRTSPRPRRGRMLRRTWPSRRLLPSSRRRG